MKRLLSRQNALDTGIHEVRADLATATTERMREMVLNNPFDTERELAIRLMIAAIWEIPYDELARMCGISNEAARAIQEIAINEVASLQVPKSD